MSDDRLGKDQPAESGEKECEWSFSERSSQTEGVPRDSKKK
ncbi:hypothetical protein [Tautonia rosea]|nr:hypothetical protein [Tautonia rosea]